MGTFVTELAKKLAERWVTLLVLPGALFVAAVGIGVRLGHSHALDYARLTKAIATVARQPAGTQAMLAVAVLLAASGTGLAVQALAGLTRRLWLGPWTHLLAPVHRWRVASRCRRWHRHVEQRQTLQDAHPRASRTSKQQERIDAAADRANRIAWTEPGRPTWMGDRIHSLEQIARNRHGLDLTFAWPRLWLVLPDTTRSEITTAHSTFAAAIATATWAWPYLLLTSLWWPSALIAMAIGVTGWARARAAVTDMTTLSEAALDLHGRTLAHSLGITDWEVTGPLTLTEGEQLTALIRKGR